MHYWPQLQKDLVTSSQSVVFVGGAVTELYATDKAATEVRATDDVDCVVELVSYKEFTVIEEELRKLKFKNDTESTVICRWIYKGIKVDIMPNDASVIGFSNPWYADGMRNSINYKLEENLTIRIFARPGFWHQKWLPFQIVANMIFVRVLISKILSMCWIIVCHSLTKLSRQMIR